MLSNYTYSKYSINKGYNDDVKLFSLYYFELISNPRELETEYWEFEDCKVKLNSLYFNFSGGHIPPIPINFWKEIFEKNRPLKEIDNKYYFVVWCSDTNSNWRIIKFFNDTNSKKELDSYGRYKLIFKEYIPFYDFTLLIRGEQGDADHTWKDDNGTYFKFLYRWDETNESNTPFISPKTGQITNLNLKQQNNINSNDWN